MPSILGSAQWARDMSESIWLLPRLVLCRTAKHGSTSWANNFVKMYLRDKRTVKTQVYLRRLEGKAFTREAKEAVIRGLREKQHNYTSFFVCRNPVEKFLSVYNYLMDARVRFEAKLKTKTLKGEEKSIGDESERSGWFPKEVSTFLVVLPPQVGQEQQGDKVHLVHIDYNFEDCWKFPFEREITLIQLSHRQATLAYCNRSMTNASHAVLTTRPSSTWRRLTKTQRKRSRKGNGVQI